MLFSRQLPLGNLVLHFIKLVQISTEKAFQGRKSSKNTCSQETKDCASLDSPNSLFLPDRRTCQPGATAH